MTLYLKYRPQKISELDLASAREVLLKLVAKGDLPHAFLFAGPKGTGKTSSARILAKAINCEKNEVPAEPCNECETCKAITAGHHVDVIEMDAASSRGIDDVRALKEQIALSPLVARKKIYIIDEAHMLTTEAANALLKTLEEPPSHAMFILATTDPQKLPGTIESRLTFVPFQKATNEELKGKLTQIAKAEKIDFEPEALDVIANASDGAFRDAVKLFESLALSGTITKKAAIETLIGDNFDEEVFVNFILTGKTSEALSVTSKLSTLSQSRAFVARVVEHLHKLLLDSMANNTQTDSLLILLDQFIEAHRKIKDSPVPNAPITIAIANSLKQQIMTNKFCQKKKEFHELAPEAANTAEIIMEEVPKEIVSYAENCDEAAWTKLLQSIKLKNASVEALLRAAKPLGFNGEKLSVGVYYKFHKERLEVNNSRDTFEEAALSVFGKNIKVDYRLTEPPERPSLTEPAAPDIINAAKEIFGN